MGSLSPRQSRLLHSLCSTQHCATAWDLQADCEQEAKATLWRIEERLSALPAAERAPYADLCIARAVQTLFRRENQRRCREVSLDGSAAIAKSVEALPDARHIEWGFLAADRLLDHLGRPDLHAAVSELSPDEQGLLDLVFVRRLRDAECGEHLGVSADTAKKRRQRLLEKLREGLRMTACNIREA